MSNITTYPLQDNYKTQATQSLSAVGTEVFVATDISFTYPSGVTTYLVINPGKSNQETVETSAYNATTNAFTIVTRNVDQGASMTTTAQTHSVGSEVIVTDNYKFWEDIATAINSKIDWDGTGIEDSFDMETPTSSVRIRDDAGSLKFTDGSNSEISLTTIAAASGADEKVAISATDTTPGNLSDKITDWDGITSTINNPAGDEDREFAVDLTDTTIFSDAWVADRAVITDGSGNIFQATTTIIGWVEQATAGETAAGTANKFPDANEIQDEYGTNYISSPGVQTLTTSWQTSNLTVATGTRIVVLNYSLESSSSNPDGQVMVIKTGATTARVHNLDTWAAERLLSFSWSGTTLTTVKDTNTTAVYFTPYYYKSL